MDVTIGMNAIFLTNLFHYTQKINFYDKFVPLNFRIWKNLNFRIWKKQIDALKALEQLMIGTRFFDKINPIRENFKR